ncbi:MAG TPA: hypothetical protein DCP68_05590 [Ruminococcus sp.]|nr:hypothetical protein [Ruminococcus sp.]
MIKTGYEEYLAAHGTLTYSNVGVSMMPLLRQGRDLFTVRAKGKARCKKYDVVLYRRPPAHYVLHRVIEVREKDYVILGDNCIMKETGITDADIIGVMTEFYRDGKRHTTDELPYRIYSRAVVAAAPLRTAWRKLRQKAGRFLRRLTG